MDVGDNERNLLPPEICDILPDQPLRGDLVDEHVADLIEATTTPLDANTGPLIALNQEPVPKHPPPAPGINYDHDKPSINEKVTRIPRPIKLAFGGRLTEWAVLLINDGNPQNEFQGVGDPALKKAVRGLMDMCSNFDMQVGGEPFYTTVR